MNITDVQLMAYADGELDSRAMRDVEQAIGADPQAQAKVEMFRQTGSLLKAACAEGWYADGSAHLRVKPAGRRRVSGRLAAAVAACLVAGVAGFGGGKLASAPGSARDAFVSEVAEYHQVFSREGAHLVEVPAERRAELQGWLGERLGRTMPVPDLSRVGLRFAGGRMLVVDGKPVGELMYTREAGLPVAFCVTPFDGPAQRLRVEEREGLQLASWTDGRHAYVVVGDISKEAAADAAGLAAAQL